MCQQRLQIERQIRLEPDAGNVCTPQDEFETLSEVERAVDTCIASFILQDKSSPSKKYSYALAAVEDVKKAA